MSCNYLFHEVWSMGAWACVLIVNLIKSVALRKSVEGNVSSCEGALNMSGDGLVIHCGGWVIIQHYNTPSSALLHTNQSDCSIAMLYSGDNVTVQRSRPKWQTANRMFSKKVMEWNLPIERFQCRSEHSNMHNGMLPNWVKWCPLSLLMVVFVCFT